MTRRGLNDLWAGPFDLPPLNGDPCPDFAKLLYGPIPDPPNRIAVERESLSSCERLSITVTKAERRFAADAGLWRPAKPPIGLIVGLDFTGPAGTLPGDDFPLDPAARIFTRDHGDRLTEAVRGIHAGRWPIDLLTDAGFALLVACYGSWAPDDPDAIETHGLKPLLGDTGAISLWAWTISRLIDTARTLFDPGHIVAAGHSRLGKAALWAGAHDERIGTVFANNAGAGGTAPARHLKGETLSQMAEAFPHWIKPQTGPLPVDQHQLMASLAPRRLYVASAEDDAWADPLGTYEALRAASRAWPDPPEWPDALEMWDTGRVLHNRHLGHHIRQGGHDLTRADWELFLDWFRRSG